MKTFNEYSSTCKDLEITEAEYQGKKVTLNDPIRQCKAMLRSLRFMLKIQRKGCGGSFR